MDNELEIELKNFYVYLKDKGYAPDVCEFIMMTFKSLNHNYQEYVNFDPAIIDVDLFIKRYIDTFKKIGNFIVLRDVNDNIDFLKRVRPINNRDISVGYALDGDNRYYITTKNPKYFCGLAGLTDNITNEVFILFDATMKEHFPLLMNTLIHELTHVYQKGFDIPWFVLNRDHFTKMLREGHAMREARHVTKNKSSFYSIPFAYNEAEKEFETVPNNDYHVYKYLYFKLEILLGHDFMTSWATAREDNSFLGEAHRILDDKYGHGTFKKLYENIQIILQSLNNFKAEDLATIASQHQDILSLYGIKQDNTLNFALDEYERISDVLSDEETFKKVYEQERATLLSTKQYFVSLNMSNSKAFEKLDERINNLTEKNYRRSLEQSLESLKEEIDAKSDFRYFKLTVSSNIAVCNTIINNPKHLTNALVALESLVLKCLIDDIDKQLETPFESFRKYRYYISNIGSQAFNYKAMSSVKKKLTCLSMKTFLQNQQDNPIKNDQDCFTDSEEVTIK